MFLEPKCSMLKLFCCQLSLKQNPFSAVTGALRNSPWTKCFWKRLLLFKHLSHFSAKSSTVSLSSLNKGKMIQTFQPWNESCQRFCLLHAIFKIEKDFSFRMRKNTKTTKSYDTKFASPTCFQIIIKWRKQFDCFPVSCHFFHN